MSARIYRAEVTAVVYFWSDPGLESEVALDVTPEAIDEGRASVGPIVEVDSMRVGGVDLDREEPLYGTAPEEFYGMTMGEAHRAMVAPVAEGQLELPGMEEATPTRSRTARTTPRRRA